MVELTVSHYPTSFSALRLFLFFSEGRKTKGNNTNTRSICSEGHLMLTSYSSVRSTAQDTNHWWGLEEFLWGSQHPYKPKPCLLILSCCIPNIYSPCTFHPAHWVTSSHLSSRGGARGRRWWTWSRLWRSASRWRWSCGSGCSAGRSPPSICSIAANITSAVKRSIGFTIGFHNHREGLY